MIITEFASKNRIRVIGTILILFVYVGVSWFFYWSLHDKDGPRIFFSLTAVWLPIFGGLLIGHIWQGVGHKRIGVPVLAATGLIFGLIAYLVVIAVHTGDFGVLYPDRSGPKLLFRITILGGLGFFWVAALFAFVRPIIFRWLKENRQFSNKLAGGLATAITKGLPIIWGLFATNWLQPPPGLL